MTNKKILLGRLTRSPIWGPKPTVFLWPYQISDCIFQHHFYGELLEGRGTPTGWKTFTVSTKKLDHYTPIPAKLTVDLETVNQVVPDAFVRVNNTIVSLS